ncbi:MAG: tail fiber domain-containing protein [Ferruginibacter sp.]
MKNFAMFCFIVTTLSNVLYAQNVGIGTTTPDSSALLEIKSTAKGVLLPRMTTEQRNAIANPVVGLTIFNLDDKCTDIYDGSNWIKNCGSKQTGVVNVAADTWIQKANFGGAARLQAVGFSIGNKGYIGTGYGNDYLKDFWEYDPTSNTWAQKADFGGTARYLAAGFSINTKGYIGTGIDGTRKNDFWEYDPALNTWTQKANFGSTARFGAVGFSILSKGYIGTGFDGVDRDDFWEYDPTGNTWTQRSSLSGGGRQQAAGFSMGGKGYISTGKTVVVRYNDLWEYNPAGNIWTSKASYPGGGVQGATAFSIGALGYLGLGFDGFRRADFWQYDPVANVWNQKSNFPASARTTSAGFSIGNKGYIGTGDVGQPSIDFWEYNSTATTYPSVTTTYDANAVQISDGIWTKTFDNAACVGCKNVGLGITAPNAPLQFANSTANRKLVLYEGANNDHQFYGFGVNSGVLRYQVNSNADDHVFYSGGSTTSSNELMRIKGNGNVGISNANPGNKLSVGGNIDISGYLGIGVSPSAPIQLDNSTGNKKIVFFDENYNDHQFSGFGLNVSNMRYQIQSITDDHVFYAGTSPTTSNELLRIKGNGNIGIGTNNPIAPLTFSNTIGNKITLYGSSTSAQYGFGIQGGLLQMYTDAEAADIAFGYGGSANVVFVERMRIKGNGIVGIGTKTPTKQLEVVGAASATPVALMVANKGGFGPAQLELVSDYGTSNQWRPGYIKSNDIGNFTGALEFYTNGSGGGNLTGSVKGFEVRNGVAYTATGTVSSFSDARLKNNVQPFTDGLNIINQIHPVSFYYNADAPFATNNQQVGIIAQDLEKIAPYMVDKNHQNGFEDLRSVNNQAYTFLLINAVQTQQQQIEQLQSANNKQQQQIDVLKKQVQQLLQQK